MSRHAREKNPEIRPSCELPLFEQSFYKFAGERAETPDSHPAAAFLTSPAIQSGRSTLPANGETGDCGGLSGANSGSSPRDVARARNSDPGTSHKAAKRVCNLGRTRDAIKKILSLYGPSTDERIRVMYIGLLESGEDIPLASPSGLRSRRSELVGLGFVEDSGDLGKTEMGNPAIIWRLRK